MRRTAAEEVSILGTRSAVILRKNVCVEVVGAQMKVTAGDLWSVLAERDGSPNAWEVSVVDSRFLEGSHESPSVLEGRDESPSVLGATRVRVSWRGATRV